jgi:mitochondrial fission protein ELM1
MVSFTRRTPAPAREAWTRRLAALPASSGDGTGENPYFAFTAAADAILVTEDSTNLATDAAATGPSRCSCCR